MNLRDTLCILLSALLIGPLMPVAEAAQGGTGAAPSQASAPAAGAKQETSPTILSNPYRRLRIVVLRGKNGVNVPGGLMIATPAVEVRDANDRLIEGAAVTFETPLSGPGARFPGGKNALETKTDSAGQAIADGYEPNGALGRFVVKVTARYEGVITQTEIRQSNVAPDSKSAADGRSGGGGLFSGKKKYLWLGAAGAGVAAAILLTRNGSSSGTSVSVTPGPIVIGGR